MNNVRVDVHCYSFVWFQLTILDPYLSLLDHFLDRIPFFIALRLSVRPFEMPLEELSFVKTLATFGIINATESLI